MIRYFSSSTGPTSLLSVFLPLNSLTRMSHKFSTALRNVGAGAALAGFATLQGVDPASPANLLEAHTSARPSFARHEFCETCGLTTVHFAKEGRGFEQLGALLPEPNEVRLASGAPGPSYWQQEANYFIAVELDERNSKIIGNGTIEYVNHSPHTLSYLWLQLDQNALAADSKRSRGGQALPLEGKPGNPAEVEFEAFRTFAYEQDFRGGYRLLGMSDAAGDELNYTVVHTNMRIDLAVPLEPGQSFSFKIGWEFNIVDEALAFRHGRRKLKDGDYTYHIAQWYPRMCAYYDRQGWQVKPYIGLGEFALEFGRFEVHITTPDDFVVAATGELQNTEAVLSPEERNRLQRARNSNKPIMIVDETQAIKNLENKSRRKKTWIFKAEKVRDFAFAASRGYMWDAMGVEVAGRKVMAMSVYPRESIALWKQFSTEAVAQALRKYSDMVYPYPYPVAWSAWGAEGGMEYPMISFQTSRDIDDEGTYPLRHRGYVIGVIIHEVGHNWFPMIINNDERQWMWMDEGLNSFIDHLAGSEFDPVLQRSNLKMEKGVIETMTKKDDPVIMMAADNMTHRSFQAYAKPTLGLVLLRESILERNLFDFAFKEYARRWAFKRPTPADFFRTMEDASGVDLDWFWRGWFFGNDHVDMSVESVNSYRLDDGEPSKSLALNKKEEEAIPQTPYEEFLEEVGTVADRNKHLQDWYYAFDPYLTSERDLQDYDNKIEKLEDWQKKQLEFGEIAYVVTVKNEGGLIMPLVLDIEFTKGRSRRLQIPVEIWRLGDEMVKIPFISKRKVKTVVLDRDNAFADADLANNIFPREIKEGRFKLKTKEKQPNPMRATLFPDADNQENGGKGNEAED